MEDIITDIDSSRHMFARARTKPVIFDLGRVLIDVVQNGHSKSIFVMPCREAADKDIFLDAFAQRTVGTGALAKQVTQWLK